VDHLVKHEDNPELVMKIKQWIVEEVGEADLQQVIQMVQSSDILQ